MSEIIVALSGGVDSSVAAALLAEQGHALRGVMLQLWAEPGPAGADNLCCTPDAVTRAQEVAGQLGIPFQLLDARELFRQAVVEAFIAEYAAARTPNPCLFCNRRVRFGFFLDWTLRQGAGFLATGHYARVRQAEGRYQLLRGRDPAKDQSYVLYVLGQGQLAHVLFPVGDLTKQEVRAIARSRGLPVAEQPESQDICFVAGGDYRRFLAAYAPELAVPGPIVDTAGRVVGEHGGLIHYTIGQRKGIGVAAARPLYVLALDPQRNRVIVGSAAELGQDECVVAEVAYSSGVTPDGPFEASAKIRYRHQEVLVTATPLPDGRLYVRFARPQRDVTPGQHLVLYDGETVLGGGVICASWEIATLPQV